MRNRVIRVPDRLWHAAQTAADRRGEPLAEAIRRFLADYAADTDGQARQDDVADQTARPRTGVSD